MEEATNIPSIAKQEEIVTQMCMCPECPSWIESGERGGFCLKSIPKSRYISEENGCICPGCPVADRLGLNDLYCCTRK
ncbi:MAG TPA: DUF2769 domain-containing protein [Methanosarcina sp.]|nr:DUF2769 domain-containing protein [Methanosarcina sp.]